MFSTNHKEEFEISTTDSDWEELLYFYNQKVRRFTYEDRSEHEGDV